MSKLFNGVAAGLAGTFSSRNNEIGSYWAFGEMYEYAIENQEDVFVFDLMSGETNCTEPRITSLTDKYRDKLWRLIDAYGADRTRVTSTTIRALFGAKTSLHVCGFGDVFTCVVTITDNRGRLYISEVANRCMPTSQWKESPNNFRNQPEISI